MNHISRIADVAERLWRRFVWSECNISAVLASGVKIRIRSRSEWDVFVEVFVEGEYDEAIRLALESATGRPARIIDLGANVGFFGLRCLDVSRAAGKACEVLAVEGAGSVFAELHRRCGANDFSPGSVLLCHGLVGKTAGRGYIYDGAYAGANTVVPDGGKRSNLPFRVAHAVLSEYLDLERLVAWNGSIDLIKCDIEGSEFEFLQNYPDLLGRTRNLVIEFHPFHCDAQACRNLLDSLGFVRQRVIKSFPTHDLELYLRVRM